MHIHHLQNNDKTSPLLKIIFIQRVLKFACRKPKYVLIHSFVTKEWYSTVVDYSFTPLMLKLVDSTIAVSTLPTVPEPSVLSSVTLFEAFVKLCHFDMMRERTQIIVNKHKKNQHVSRYSRRLVLYLRDAFERTGFCDPLNNNDNNNNNNTKKKKSKKHSTDTPPLLEPFIIPNPDKLEQEIIASAKCMKYQDSLKVRDFLKNEFDSSISTTQQQQQQQQQRTSHRQRPDDDLINPRLQGLPLPFTQNTFFSVTNNVFHDFNKVLVRTLKHSSSDHLIIAVSQFLHFLLFKQSLEDFRYLIYFFHFDHFHFSLQACSNKNNKKAFYLFEKHFIPLHLPFPNANERDNCVLSREYKIYSKFENRCVKLAFAAFTANNLDLVRFFCKKDTRFLCRILTLAEGDVICANIKPISVDYFNVLTRIIAMSLTDVTENDRIDLFLFAVELYVEYLNLRYQVNNTVSQVLRSDGIFRSMNWSRFYFNLFLRDDVELIRYFLENKGNHPDIYTKFVDPRLNTHLDEVPWFFKKKSLFLMAMYMGAVNCVEYFCHWAYTKYRKSFKNNKKTSASSSSNDHEARNGYGLGALRGGLCLSSVHLDDDDSEEKEKKKKKNKSSSYSKIAVARDCAATFPLQYAVAFSSSAVPVKWTQRQKRITTADDDAHRSGKLGLFNSNDMAKQRDEETALQLVNIILKYSKMEEDLNRQHNKKGGSSQGRLIQRRQLQTKRIETKQCNVDDDEDDNTNKLCEQHDELTCCLALARKLGRITVAETLVKAVSAPSKEDNCEH